MDRLTIHNENGEADLCGNFSAERIFNFLRENLSVLDAAEFQNILSCLARYEDAEEQGRLVPIVRCHECVHRNKGWNKDWWNKETVYCDLHSETPELSYTGFDMIMPKDGYCSYGEREETGNA